MMTLYHGSYTEIREIDLSKSEPNKDFGRGFYTTSILKHAEAWAWREGKKRRRKGVVSVFEFDYDSVFACKRYKTKVFDGYTREWLDFVDLNRSGPADAPAHDYDIVEGPIADDMVNQNMPEYKKGVISADEFLNMLRYDGSHQICFCTQKSLDAIERVDLNAHFKIKNINSAVTRHLETNDNLSEENAQDIYYESETYRQLTDENTMLYLKSWQEVYEMLKKEIQINE